MDTGGDHYLPWDRKALLHPAIETTVAGYPFGIKYLFASLTAFARKFVIGKGELVAHVTLVLAGLLYHYDLTSGTYSHLP